MNFQSNFFSFIPYDSKFMQFHFWFLCWNYCSCVLLPGVMFQDWIFQRKRISRKFTNHNYHKHQCSVIRTSCSFYKIINEIVKNTCEKPIYYMLLLKTFVMFSEKNFIVAYAENHSYLGHDNTYHFPISKLFWIVIFLK